MTRYPVKHISAGFTIIEAIIAVGIISSALIVGLALAYSNLTSAQENNQRIIATQLAREALEVVRNVRDSNWLKRTANFDKDHDSNNGIQLYNFNDATDGSTLPNYIDIAIDQTMDTTSYLYDELSVAAGNEALLACVQSGSIGCRIQKKDGIYFQSSSAAPGAIITPFYRRVTLKPICYSSTSDFDFVEFEPGAPNMTCDTPNSTLIGFLASADVVWKRGQDKISQIQAKERFYDWRK